MKYLFALINLILLAGSAFFCVDIFHKTVLKTPSFMPDINAPANRPAGLVQNQESTGAYRQGHEIIVQRNLFKVEIEKKEGPGKESSGSTEKLEPTTLSLTLWGTVTGGSELYAVIEDKKSRLQALYQEGDPIQEATIKKILKKEIILTFQGKDQVLEMEIDAKKAGPVAKPLENIIPGAVINDGSVPLPQTSKSTPGNTDDIMTQIKFRPFFTKGAPSGVMVFGIKPDSVFNRSGLRNGDILKTVNGNPVASVEEASSALSDIQNASVITLVRSGETKEISFGSGQPGGEQGNEGESGEVKEEKLPDLQEKPEVKSQAPEDQEPEKTENSEDRNKGEES